MHQNFSRRSFLRTAGLGSVGLALAPSLKGQVANLARKPNLIVLLPDQQRADTIACYGATRSVAPNIDKLASQSCIFERTYITQPICAPSRSSFMTGLWPHANGCMHNSARLDAHFQCLPELIADDDYQTGYMGKWHLGDEVFAQHGFGEWVSILDGHHAKFSPGRDPHAKSDYYKFLEDRGVDLSGSHATSFRKFESTLPLELSKPKFLEIRACDFMERHRRDPFILFVAFFEPHPPYNGPLNSTNPVDETDIDPTADHIFGEDMPLRYRLRQEGERRKVGETPDKHLRIKQRYLGLVTQVDRSVGAILTKLEDLGLADNTIVVHTSDHGDMMGAHRLIGKGVMFEEAVRVPYLVRMPNQRSSVSIAQPISHIDFNPTMIDLLGHKPPENVPGKSRAAFLRGESMPAEPVFAQWNPGQKKKPLRHTKLANGTDVARATRESTRAAIFPDGWKICLRDNDQNELYNLRFDPREEHNLYKTAPKETLAKLTGEIHKWQESARDAVKV